MGEDNMKAQAEPKNSRGLSRVTSNRQEELRRLSGPARKSVPATSLVVTVGLIPAVMAIPVSGNFIATTARCPL